MESNFLFILLAVLIYGQIFLLDAAAMPNSYSEGDRLINIECALRYLKTEKNVDIDIPMSREPPKCRNTWSEIRQAVIEEHIPSEATCLRKELTKSQKSLDLFMTISAIRESDYFSESEKKIQLINFRNELQKDLRDIAVECRTSADKFISLLNGTLENNETLIAIESTYCLAKYVTDKGILTLPDVNLNPHNIEIKNLNCSIVVAEEMRKDEKRVRDQITLRDEAAIACLLNVYKENKIFELSFASLVLRDLDMPVETKRTECIKYDALRAHRSTPFINCYKMDKDFDPILLRKIEEVNAKATQAQLS